MGFGSRVATSAMRMRMNGFGLNRVIMQASLSDGLHAAWPFRMLMPAPQRQEQKHT
jgi:hypothetical protein